MQTIYVDFNTMQQFDTNDNAIIAQLDHPQDCDIHLHEGERLIVYDEEIRVEAIAHKQGDFWVGAIDWSTRKAA